MSIGFKIQIQSMKMLDFKFKSKTWGQSVLSSFTRKIKRSFFENSDINSEI